MADRQRIRDWSNLQFFLAVVQTGSFQSAAKLLGTNQSTVARRMHRLEEELEAKLFDRHAHGMLITDSGQAMIAKISAIGKAVVEVEKSLFGLQTDERGLVTIAVTEGVGSIWLISALTDFYNQFPQIDLTIKTNQRDIDLLSHDADISLQLVKPTASRMVAYKATNIAHRLFVSQKYIDRNGFPKSVSDFPRHEFLDYEPYHSESYTEWWVEGVLSTARVRLSCNSASIYLGATRQGFGIGLFPAFYARAAPDLIPLPIAVPCESQVWVVTHEETNKSARVRAVLGFLRERFTADRKEWFHPAR